MYPTERFRIYKYRFINLILHEREKVGEDGEVERENNMEEDGKGDY